MTIESDEQARELLGEAMRRVDAYYKQRGIFQDRFGFGDSPAVVVIDFACGWTDEAYAAGSRRLDGPVENTGRLLKEARARAIAHGGTLPVRSKTPRSRARWR